MDTISELQRKFQSVSLELEHAMERCSHLEDVLAKEREATNQERETEAELRSKCETISKKNSIAMKELQELSKRRAVLALELDSLDSRIAFIPNFFFKKIESACTNELEAIEELAKLPSPPCNWDSILESVEGEVDDLKGLLRARLNYRRRVEKEEERSMQSRLEEEEQASALILACVDGLVKKNSHMRTQLEKRNKCGSGSKEMNQVMYPDSTDIGNSVNDSFNESQSRPWFKTVKRRKVCNEITISRVEFKTGNEILQQQSDEYW